MMKKKQASLFNDIAYFLKEAGFRKNSNHYFKRNGEIGFCLNFQNDKWNTSDNVRFTINIGLFCDSFWLEHFDFQHTGIIPKFPKEYECAVRFRIGKFSNSQEMDKWWELTSSTNIEEVRNEIVQSLKEDVLPFFLAYNTANDIMKLKNNDL